jgi:hypothetical protein
LEKTVVKAKRIEEDHARHNSVEQEEQQHQMMNPTKTIIPIVNNLVEEENPFNLCNGYQNLQRSTTYKPNVLRVTSTQIGKITSM